MNQERLLQPENRGHQNTAPGPGADLTELRRRSNQFRQAAREALERARAQGDTLRQLENLQNESGQ